MILIREITPPAIDCGHGRGLREHAVDPEQHLHVRSCLGIEVDVRSAALDRLGDDRVDELDDRRVGARDPSTSVNSRSVSTLLGLGDDVFDTRQPADQRRDVLGRRRRGDDRHARDHRDLVDRQHVRRVGHRDEQACRRRGTAPAAPRYCFAISGRDQVRRAHVDLEHRQVDVVDAEALRERTRQLVVANRAGLDQDLAGRPALLAREPDRRLDRLRAARSRARR